MAAIYTGGTIYRDMADNLSKITFPVIVTERYNPNIHYSLMGENAPPPIFDPGPEGLDAPCHARLSGDYIIDALVNGQYISFEDPNDIEILADWIEKYIKSYEGIDLTRYPDRKSFLMNAQKALGMLKGNINRKNDWNERVKPSDLTLAEILAAL